MCVGVCCVLGGGGGGTHQNVCFPMLQHIVKS